MSELARRAAPRVLADMQGSREVAGPYARNVGTGEKIPGNYGVVPLLLGVGKGLLRVIGTGFYITRYGTVATARHVVDEFVRERDANGDVVTEGFVLHSHGDSELILRPIRFYALSERFDIAVVQADNFKDTVPDAPLMNMRGCISPIEPPRGTRLVTFGYPENETLDFTQPAPPLLRGDFYEGELLEHVDRGPGIDYRHYQTSIEMPHGTSGGPVFFNGNIIGINCRAWDFRGSEHEGWPLSSVVPIAHAFELEVGVSTIPPRSWESQQIPAERRIAGLKFGELVACGVISSA